MYKDGVSTFSHAYLVGKSVMEISPGGDTPTYRIPRTSNMLRITVTENESEQRWVLQGRLTVSFLEELIASWYANRDRPQAQSRTVDLNEVTCIDKDGEQVLLMMIKD